MKNKIVVVSATAAALTVTAVNAFAVSIVDYTTLGTAVNAELTPAISAGIPIMGTIMAVGVGLHMLRKMVGK